MKRLRLGIILIVVSWLPIAQIVLYIAHNNGNLTTEKASSTTRLIIWGVQIIIGLVGLWLVGKLAMKVAKKDGWKQTPKHIWDLFWHGQEDLD